MAWLPLSARLWSCAWLIAKPLAKRRALSPKGLSRWCDFYAKEEDPESPPLPLREFCRLLLLYGPPDVGNPWPQGEEAHYRVHPGGFLAGEIERALTPSDEPIDSLKTAAALDRLGVLLHWGSSLVSAQAYWAQEDMRFACALSIADGHWELAGAGSPKTVINALLAGLLEPGVAPGLLIARRMFEDARHPPPWRSRARLAPPPPPQDPAPPANIARWREQRALAGLAASPQPPEAAQSERHEL